MKMQGAVMANLESIGDMKIKAAVVEKRGAPYKIEDLVLRDLRHDEVLVKILATGMCHTDMVAQNEEYGVPYPVVLGHEGSGVVERVGTTVQKVKPGDHVVLTFMSCGHCESCIKGAPTYCLNFFPLNFSGARDDGSVATHDANREIHDHFFGQSSFGSFAIANERNVVKVPNEAPLEILGPLGCGFQTGAGAVMNALKVGPGQSFAVFGAGAVGLSAVMAAKIVGASTIIAIDINDSRLQLAKDLGATHVINGKAKNAVEEIKALTGGGGADFTLEATGLPAILRQAIDATGTLGTCAVVGAAPLGTEAKFDINDVMVPGKTIKGVIEGDSIPDVFIPQLVEHFMKGEFPIDKLTRTYSLDQINEAAEDSKKGTTVKPIIKIG